MTIVSKDNCENGANEKNSQKARELIYMLSARTFPTTQIILSRILLIISLK